MPVNSDPSLSPAVAERLDRARSGHDESRHLTVAGLAPGMFGVLNVTIVQVHPIQTYRRKQGGDGLLGRLRVADATGEVELVLWDDETNHIRDGTFGAGVQLRLAGATVKQGFRGGVELGLRGSTWKATPSGHNP
jgi:hypothetical protein